jgi:uncharacterized lipoprotein YajG
MQVVRTKVENHMKLKVLLSFITLMILAACASNNKAEQIKVSKTVEEVVIEKDTRIRIGVPSERPEEAIEALVKYYKNEPSVKLAKLGLIEFLNEDGNSKFNYTIGVDVVGDDQQVIQEMLSILKFVPEARWPIAIVPVSDNYFTSEAIIFYSKKR